MTDFINNFRAIHHFVKGILSNGKGEYTLTFVQDPDDFLPTDNSLRRGGRYSQTERNFGLSVLSLCGRLPDIEREGECSQENNATFDKLMRDFKGTPIPFAMELFL